MDDLRIRIIGTLNTASTVAEINAQLANLRTNPVNLNVQVNTNGTNAINGLNSQIQRLGSNETNRATQNLNTQLRNIGNSAQQTSHHALSLGDAFRQAFTKFPIWMIASTAFFAPITAIKQLVSTLYTLDERMTSIKKVLDNANMAVVFQQANDAAMKFGQRV
jgi:hypothetical protein